MSKLMSQADGKNLSDKQLLNRHEYDAFTQNTFEKAKTSGQHDFASIEEKMKKLKYANVNSSA